MCRWSQMRATGDFFSVKTHWIWHGIVQTNSASLGRTPRVFWCLTAPVRKAFLLKDQTHVFGFPFPFPATWTSVSSVVCELAIGASRPQLSHQQVAKLPSNSFTSQLVNHPHYKARGFPGEIHNDQILHRYACAGKVREAWLRA